MAQTLWLLGRHVRRHLVDDGLGQLHDDDHPDAGPRHDDVPPAADDLGHVHHGHPAGLRPAGAHGRRLHAAHATALLGTGFFLPEGLVVNNSAAGDRRRAAAPVAALVLVLFAPGRVHHDPAGDGHGLATSSPASPASRSSATSRWSIRSRHRGPGLHRVGPPHVHLGHEPAARHDVHGLAR